MTDNKLIYLILILFVFGTVLIWSAAFFEYIFLRKKKEKTVEDEVRIKGLVLLIVGVAFLFIPYTMQLYLFYQGEEIIIKTKGGKAYQILE